jgi:hypothetical protein
MQLLIDDDVPKRPDPILDDLSSAQARRALLLAMNWGNSREDQGAEPKQPWPVTIHY